MIKLLVYRTEKKSPDGELIQEAGWKVVGRGQMRLLHDAGVYFLEFRPEVSEGGSHEPEDEVGNSKQRLGRVVLSARVDGKTKLDLNKKSVQCNLLSADTAGNANFARYNISLDSPEKAQEFVRIVRQCAPAE
mmetsp:Transcript_1152/g.3017  ORF Transcript_1152/g.3017 Transcript_1152/m.3017 type:complete len:133 (+) Transcript_1152:82-480(+)